MDKRNDWRLQAAFRSVTAAARRMEAASVRAAVSSPPSARLHLHHQAPRSQSLPRVKRKDLPSHLMQPTRKCCVKTAAKDESSSIVRMVPSFCHVANQHFRVPSPLGRRVSSKHRCSLSLRLCSLFLPLLLLVVVRVVEHHRHVRCRCSFIHTSSARSHCGRRRLARQLPREQPRVCDVPAPSYHVVAFSETVRIPVRLILRSLGRDCGTHYSQLTGAATPPPRPARRRQRNSAVRDRQSQAAAVHRHRQRQREGGGVGGRDRCRESHLHACSRRRGECRCGRCTPMPRARVKHVDVREVPAPRHVYVMFACRICM